MSEYLTTKEIADLLRLKERKVYDLAASGDIPCSRATGKLLFPKKAIDAWIAKSASGLPAPQQPSVDRPPIFLGSHDPLLNWAIRESRCAIACSFDGSLDGLNRFAAVEGAAAAIHMFDPETGEWNAPYIKKNFADENIVLIEWCKRDRGLIVPQSSKIKAIEDIADKRIAMRQAEAGSHVLLKHLLTEQNVELSKLDQTTPLRSETDAALAVLEGSADVAFGLPALAKQYGLSFVPIITERFDILVDRKFWFAPPWQQFINFCRTPAFIQKAEDMPGYDISDLETVHFNG